MYIRLRGLQQTKNESAPGESLRRVPRRGADVLRAGAVLGPGAGP